MEPDDRTGEALFFVHIFKTAGTSLGLALDRHFAPQSIFPGYLPQDFLNLRGGFEFYRGHVPFRYVLKQLPSAYFLVTLRDPIERTVSALRHLLRLDHDPLGVALRTMGVKRFLGDETLSSWISNLQVRMLSLDLDDFNHSDEYSTTELAESDYDVAVESLGRIDMVAAADQADAALRSLHRGLACRRRERVPRLNVGSPTWEPTKEEIRSIRALNRLDLRLWNKFVSESPTGLAAKRPYLSKASHFKVVRLSGFTRADLDPDRNQNYVFMGQRPSAHVDFDCVGVPRRFRLDLIFSEEPSHFEMLELAIGGMSVPFTVQRWPSGITTLRGDVPQSMQRSGPLRLSAKTQRGILRPGYEFRQSLAFSYIGLT